MQKGQDKINEILINKELKSEGMIDNDKLIVKVNISQVNKYVMNSSRTTTIIPI